MTSTFVDLLGSKLMNKGEEIDTATALEGKKAVALYFSAHWCPPCRQFTPMLGKWYTDDLKAKGLEVIFVSSDRDEKSFKDYYEKEQPWLSLPFSEREKKAALSSKYKVRGIPSLVIIDGPAGNNPGQTISTNGREAVSNDPKGENFPWYPKSLEELLDGQYVKGDKGDETTTFNDAVAKDQKTFGLYFSAHWCPPCRKFTPQLVARYNKLTKDMGKDFEMIFVSSDRDAAGFNEYFAEMPWLALPFDDAGRKRKAALSSHFEVQGIPHLVILGYEEGKLKVIRSDAVGTVAGDEACAEYPWTPKLVNDLDVDPDGINEKPALILLQPNLAEDAQTKNVTEILLPLAEKFKKLAAANGSDESEFLFFHANQKNGQLCDQITEDCSCEDWKVEGCDWQLVLVDIPDRGGFYKYESKDLSVAALETFLGDYKAKKLKREQLS